MVIKSIYPIIAVAVLLLVTSSPVGAIAPSLADPIANVAPQPNFTSSGQCSHSGGGYSCTNPCISSHMKWPSYTNGRACTNYVLTAINAARSAEGVVAMVLPSNWYSLTPAQQMFVVVDLERVDRGYPPYLGLNAVLSAEDKRAASGRRDPGLARGFAVGTDTMKYPGFGGAWGGGYTVLAVDYVWMYGDGWGGSTVRTSNSACTSLIAIGCWAHRDEMLGWDPKFNPGVGLGCTRCEMGAGFAVVSGGASYAVSVELPAHRAPAMTFTWARNVVPYLG
jgi:hypothetical protein